MFPYTLGPPKKRRYTERPVVCLRSAIRDDLKRLSDQYQAQLQQTTITTTPFDVFQQIFQAAKVGWLHHMAPDRVHRSNYTQLLYAVCLELLQESMLSSSTPSSSSLVVDLVPPSFALFCLWALYHTNPLELAPNNNNNNDTNSFAKLLPLNVTGPKGNVAVRRRYYKGRIRIDSLHFGYLQQLRDLCVAAATNNNNKAVILAQQVQELLDAFLPSDCFDFCASTGPCSLEGLVAPKTVTNNPPSTIRQQQQPAAAVPIYNTAATASTHASAISSLLQLQKDIKGYFESRKSIRLPPIQAKMSNQSKRIRQTLAPLFSDPSHKLALRKPLSKLRNVYLGEVDARQTTVTRVQLRHVSFGTVAVPTTEKTDPSTKLLGHVGPLNDHVPAEQANHNSSYELVLPGSLTDTQQTTLEKAVQSLLDRDQSLLLPREPVPLSRVEEKDDATRDGVSTLGTGGVSAAATTSQVGGRAVRALLATPVPDDTMVFDPAPVGDFLTTAVPDIAPRVRTAAQLKSRREDDSDAVSDLSSEDENNDNGDDALSTMASRVGQSALQDLLTTAKSPPSTKKRRRRAATKKAPVYADLSSEDEIGDEEKDGESATATSRVGQRALQDLLTRGKDQSTADNGAATRADSSDDDDDDDDDDMVLADDPLPTEHGTNDDAVSCDASIPHVGQNAKSSRKKKPKRRASTKKRAKTNNKRGKDDDDDEEASATSSRVGVTALKNLLGS